jgi:hypothetical protein
MQRHKESRRAAGLDFGSGSGQSFRRVMYTSAVTDSRIAATITPTDISSAGVVRAVAITAVRAPMRNSTFAFITELSSRARARDVPSVRRTISLLEGRAMVMRCLFVNLR